MKVLIIALLLLSFAIPIYFYPSLPDTLVTHWNAFGQPDGHMGRFWGVFLLPFMTVIVTLLLYFLPQIDPLKKNISKFKIHYQGFILSFIIFLFLLNMIVILWNKGILVPINIALPIMLGLLFFNLGLLLGHTKRNWFIGIRTPWALSSDYNWEKTHSLGSRLFMISGILSILSIIFPLASLWISIIPVLLSALITSVYSYIVYRKEIRNKRHIS